MRKKQSQYEGLLVRASLTDTGKLPRSGDVSNSPDLIPFGIEEATNPTKLFISEFDQNLGVDLIAGKTNYIYLRGINTSTDFLQGDFYLYYALDTDLDDPSIWSFNNQLKTVTGKDYAEVTAQQKGNIFVAEAFSWIPPSDGKSYSLITIVVPSGTLPDFSGINGDFEKYIDATGNAGWNKVTIKKPIPPPQPTLLWSTSFDYEQGDTERDMHFTINTNDIPVKSLVSFDAVADKDSTGGDPTPPIDLNKTIVSTSPNFTAGIVSTVPAGYKGEITFSLYAFSPPSGSTVSFVASYNPPSTGGPVKPVLVEQVTTTN